MSFAIAMLVALCLDITIGWPDWLFARIGHPVSWIGRSIAWLDRALNKPESTPMAQKRAGILALALVGMACSLLAATIAALLSAAAFKPVLLGVIAYPFVATRSLHQHVEAVATPLLDGNLVLAREEVAKIVGRDPAQLDQAAVARAALESLSENTADGVVAPIFWGTILGLPGIVAYKVINTADSMIGHKSARYFHFGWFAAKLDDLANYIPARLCGIAFALVSMKFSEVMKIVWRDARLHRSPNAGWPETAMAAALGCRLSGPRSYEGIWGSEPWLNKASADPLPSDILSGLRLYRRALVLLSVILLCLALV